MKGHNQLGRDTMRTVQREGRQAGERRGRATGRRGGGEDDEMSAAMLFKPTGALLAVARGRYTMTE
eukprot:1243503-Pyramimonas_sp.AAC.1